MKRVVGFLVLVWLWLPVGVITAESQESDLSISFTALSRPIWALGFEDAKWLLPGKRSPPIRIAFLPLSNTTKRSQEAHSNELEGERTTRMGAWSRAIPMYLAERVWVTTDAIADVYLFVVEGKGVALLDSPVSEEMLATVLEKADAEERPALIITGTTAIDVSGLRSRIDLTLWEVRNSTTILRQTIGAQSLLESSAELALEVEAKLLTILENYGIRRQEELQKEFPAPSRDDFVIEGYLYNLETVMLQSLVQWGEFPSDFLYGEDNMFESYLWLCQAMPEAVTPRLTFLRALVAATKYGSTAHEPHIPLAEQWLAEASDQEPIGKLAPFVLRTLGKSEAFEQRRNELMKTAEGVYKVWLEKL